MSKVLAFGNTAVPLDAGVNLELVSMLEQALEHAREGDLVAGAFVLVHTGGRTRTGWINAECTHDRTASGVMTLAYRYAKATHE